MKNDSIVYTRDEQLVVWCLITLLDSFGVIDGDGFDTIELDSDGGAIYITPRNISGRSSRNR